MGLKKLLAQSILWRGFYFFSLLLVNVFISRYLRAAGTGNLYYLILLFSFAQTLFSLSADSGIIYFTSGNIIERNRLISMMGLWSAATGILVVCSTLVYFLFSSSAGQSLIIPYCVYGFFYVCGQSLANYSLAFYYSKENYTTPNFLLGLVNILFVIIIPKKAVLATPHQTQMVTYLFFSTYFIGGLLIYFFYIIQHRKESTFGLPDAIHFKQLLKYSGTALAANLVFFLVYKVDYVFVKYSPVCSPADLGNYIQVSKLGQMMLIVPQIIASVVFPRTASGFERLRINNAIIVMARLFSQLFLLAFIIVLLFGNRLFTEIFGRSFNEMKLPMLIIIPGIFSLSVLAMLSAYFSGKGKIKVNLHGAIIGLSLMITGDFLFVPKYGIIAAAIVSTLSYSANLAYALLQFYRDYSISWIEFLRWKKNDYDWFFTMLKRNAG